MFEFQFFNKDTKNWGAIETGFATEKKAISAMNKHQKKYKFVELRVVESVEYTGPFKVGSKVRVTSTAKRSDGLVEKQVFIAEITKNNGGERAEYKTLYHEVEENVLRKIETGGFVIGLSTRVEAI